MSEEQEPQPEQHEVDDPDRPRTGDPRVDAVIDDVAQIGDRPLPEQPAAFEDAHARLRRTLDGPPGDEQPASE